MPLFDAFLFVDWSAANRPTLEQPTANAVWIGEWVRFHGQNETYHRTRSDGIDHLTSRPRERSGPFWGCPSGTKIANLKATSPGFPFKGSAGVSLKARRIAEEGLPRIQESSKLYGAGSVGSQALVGIPHVYRLRRHPKPVWFSRVWPFETGFFSTPSPNRGPFILHAEIWPGIVTNIAQALPAADKSLIPDQAQVRAMCQWVKETDDNGQLGGLFARPIGLNQQEIQACVQHEGWILGAK